MILYSTNNTELRTTFKEAIFTGMPADNGLFMPAEIPSLPPDFFQTLKNRTFQENSTIIAQALIGDEIAPSDLAGIVERAIHFPAPLSQIDEYTYILELFHGPSLAFKDFGARFMAETMSHFLLDKTETLTILVATSGDTGGAVASGFHRVPGIQVVVFYPSGQVSPLQEKQFTALGDNITALEVQGTFDDCQALVKTAFLDTELRKNINLSTANSINIARLIPQIFYYTEAYRQLPDNGKPPIFSVPSGNFGNLTAGLFAQQMGLPVGKFLAATNLNDVIPEYLKTGTFRPRPSTPTISSAMDVGNPSNFSRILNLFGSTWNIIQNHITGYRFTDEETAHCIRSTKNSLNYILDPHGAVSFLALEQFRKENPEYLSNPGIVLETAHPSKFIETTTQILGHEIEIPERLLQLKDKPKQAIPTPNNYQFVKNWLLGQKEI